jgi:hypothetical protein
MAPLPPRHWAIAGGGGIRGEAGAHDSQWEGSNTVEHRVEVAVCSDRPPRRAPGAAPRWPWAPRPWTLSTRSSYKYHTVLPCLLQLKSMQEAGQKRARGRVPNRRAARHVLRCSRPLASMQNDLFPSLSISS